MLQLEAISSPPSSPCTLAHAAVCLSASPESSESVHASTASFALFPPKVCPCDTGLSCSARPINSRNDLMASSIAVFTSSQLAIRRTRPAITADMAVPTGSTMALNVRNPAPMPVIAARTKSLLSTIHWKASLPKETTFPAIRLTSATMSEKICLTSSGVTSPPVMPL